MAYSLRQRKQITNYVDSGSPGSDSIGSDANCLSRTCSRRKKRRNLTLCSTTTKETKTENSRVNLTARRQRSHTSKKRVQEVQNKEASDPTSSNKKDGTLCADQLSSNKTTILSWLIDCNIIKEGEHVTYSNEIKGNPAKIGKIARGAILCSCCQREYSVWGFEKHCESDLNQPYQDIYLLEKQQSLLEFIKIAWLENGELKHLEAQSSKLTRNSKDNHDYACPVCGDGGDLICCDKCLATYHLDCSNLERLPEGDWFCPYCVCKHCGLGDKSKQLIACFQCNKKFEWGCFKEFEKDALKDALDPDCSNLYCRHSCRKAYEILEGFVGVRNEITGSYTWRVIRQMDRTSTVSEHQYFENNAKVAITWKLMNEAFVPIVDRYSGHNVVQSVIYSLGSELPRIDYSRFYTFILEKDDEVVSAASVRVHGQRLAEMPFMATHKNYQRKGYCGYLLAIVESVLRRRLSVQSLIIPAIPERASMWRDKFGFSDLTTELKRELASFNILIFLESLLLVKDLKRQTAESDGSDRSF
ncbi:hypothetical protein K1719_017997 [Acacia pycnantha]|nr:hypothetical protein K1719_017997 [Acacia pycnantha]